MSETKYNFKRIPVQCLVDIDYIRG